MFDTHTPLSCKLVVFALLLAVTPWAVGDMIDLPVNADASIGGGDNSHTNYGSDDYLAVKVPPTTTYLSSAYKSYIRFDTSSLTGSVDQAELTLTISGNDGQYFDFTYSIYALKDGVSGESDWIETGPGGITWANAPGNDNTSANGVIMADCVLLGTLVKPSGSAYGAGGQITFTADDESALVDLLNNDTNDSITLIMVRETAQYNMPPFASRENTTYAAPQLSVNVVPEPGSFMLISASLLLLSPKRTGRSS